MRKVSERSALFCVVAAVVFWASAASVSSSGAERTVQIARTRDEKPKPAPSLWRGLIGEYGPDDRVLYILEKDGDLCFLFKGAEIHPLKEISNNEFTTLQDDSPEAKTVTFKRDKNGRSTSVTIGDTTYARRNIEPENGATQLTIKPVRPVPELLKEALAATPPKEMGNFAESDLVELVKLDPSIKLEVRYATTNNLFSSVFYSEARAFLQRPAAEAVVRVNQQLHKLGYGLLIHDAYRPWYVTKVFWDATPQAKKIFVADPSQGSRHNRGAAVDLSLFDLKTGKPVEMVGTYDETTDRSYPNYPGGTSLQRWHRDLLRRAMEAEGFTVYEAEWWHFDFNGWRRFPIGNQRFDAIGKKE